MKRATTLHVEGASRAISRRDAARSIRIARSVGLCTAYSRRSRIVQVQDRFHAWQIQHEDAFVSLGAGSLGQLLRRAIPGIATVTLTAVLAAQLVYGWSL